MNNALTALTRLLIRLIAVAALIGVPLSISDGQSIDREQAVYVRFMHAAPSAPPVYILVDDDVFQQAITLSWAALWSLDNMLTTTLALPTRDQRTHILPFAGVSPYDVFNPRPAGRYTVAFFTAPGYASEPGEREIVAALEVDLEPGYYLFILLEDAEGALTVFPVNESERPTEGESAYTLVNGIPDADTSVQLLIDGEPNGGALGNGEALSLVFSLPLEGQLQVTLATDDPPHVALHDESAPGRAFLPRTRYTLVAVRMGDEIGVLAVATGNYSGGRSETDDFNEGVPVISQIEPEYDERTHFFFVNDDELFRIIVEPTAGSELDPYLSVVRVIDGALIAFSSAPLPDNTRRVVLELSDLPGGSYVAVVTPYAFVSRGEYRIVLERLGG